MRLIFKVEKQQIYRVDSENPASQSENYLEAEFILGTDWNQTHLIKPLFRVENETKSYSPQKIGERYLTADYTCLVPCEVLRSSGHVYVSLVDETAGVKITTNEASFAVDKSGIYSGGNAESSGSNAATKMFRPEAPGADAFSVSDGKQKTAYCKGTGDAVFKSLKIAGIGDVKTAIQNAIYQMEELWSLFTDSNDMTITPLPLILGKGHKRENQTKSIFVTDMAPRAIFSYNFEFNTDKFRQDLTLAIPESPIILTGITYHFCIFCKDNGLFYYDEDKPKESIVFKEPIELWIGERFGYSKDHNAYGRFLTDSMLDGASCGEFFPMDDTSASNRLVSLSQLPAGFDAVEIEPIYNTVESNKQYVVQYVDDYAVDIIKYADSKMQYANNLFNNLINQLGKQQLKIAELERDLDKCIKAINNGGKIEPGGIIITPEPIPGGDAIITWGLNKPSPKVENETYDDLPSVSFPLL